MWMCLAGSYWICQGCPCTICWCTGRCPFPHGNFPQKRRVQKIRKKWKITFAYIGVDLAVRSYSQEKMKKGKKNRLHDSDARVRTYLGWLIDEGRGGAFFISSLPQKRREEGDNQQQRGRKRQNIFPPAAIRYAIAPPLFLFWWPGFIKKRKWKYRKEVLLSF